jgi:hypothetical protein
MYKSKYIVPTSDDPEERKRLRREWFRDSSMPRGERLPAFDLGYAGMVLGIARKKRRAKKHSLI